MPAYSFKRQFVGAVEAGDKLHTIRGKRKARPKAGQRFVAYYGMRTRQCRKLLDSVITKVQDIRIEHSNLQLPGFWSGLYPRITVDGEVLAFDEACTLARADGFPSLFQMMQFWDQRLPFEGDLIHWRKVVRG
jgi:hypothetical protein